MNTFLAQMLCESGDSRAPSSMRTLTAFIVIVIMAGWLKITWTTGAIAPLPLEGAGGIVLGALGIKAYQRGREGKPSSTTDTSFTTRPPHTP